MVAILTSAAILASLASIVSAIPSGYTDNGLEKRGFSCSTLKPGLTKADCEYMSKIGMAGQGDNVQSKNNNIWLGSDGPNKFIFTNKANPQVGIILILWDMPAGDYQSSFMNVRRSKISYSLAYGKSVTVSLANGVSGGWTALYDSKTVLSQYGQIWNTWGEFTTGNYATFDISREVHMGGNNMDVKASTGCLANLDKCSYHCKSGDSCGESGTYVLKNCDPGSQPNAAGSFDGTNWHGGCQGWSNGGTLNANFY